MLLPRSRREIGLKAVTRKPEAVEQKAEVQKPDPILARLEKLETLIASLAEAIINKEFSVTLPAPVVNVAPAEVSIPPSQVVIQENQNQNRGKLALDFQIVRDAEGRIIDVKAVEE